MPFFGGGAEKTAENAAISARDTNNALEGGLWTQFQGLDAPWIGAGTNALNMYSNALMGGPGAEQAFDAYKNSAGYGTTLKAGTDAVNANAATSGLLHSGGNEKALVNYGQGLNQQYYGNWLNNLAQQAGWGLGATGQEIGAGTQYGAQVSSNNDSAASAIANAALAQQSSWMNLLGQGLGAAAYAFG